MLFFAQGWSKALWVYVVRTKGLTVSEQSPLTPAGTLRILSICLLIC